MIGFQTRDALVKLNTLSASVLDHMQSPVIKTDQSHEKAETCVSMTQSTERHGGVSEIKS